MSDQSTIGSWFTLFRFGNSLTGLIGVFFGSLLALGEIPQGDFASITVLHGLSVWAFMCSWNALNDILVLLPFSLLQLNLPTIQLVVAN